MKPYISTDSQIERPNSRALSPVPFAADPKDVPSMRYTGLCIGTSCRKQIYEKNEMRCNTDEEVKWEQGLWTWLALLQIHH